MKHKSCGYMIRKLNQAVPLIATSNVNMNFNSMHIPNALGFSNALIVSDILQLQLPWATLCLVKEVETLTSWPDTVWA